jgi:hypothetical protein
VTIHFHVGDRCSKVTQLTNIPYATTPVDQINEAFTSVIAIFRWHRCSNHFAHRIKSCWQCSIT